MTKLPRYRELPKADGLVGSGWGLFGAGESLGRMNLVTAEKTADAALLVKKGMVFPLDAAPGRISPALFGRAIARHTLIERLPDERYDDFLDEFYPQGGSQWDSLAHVAYARDRFYNGASGSEIRSGERNTIDHWARKGIVTRGVVLDVAEVVAARGGACTSVALTVADLENARDRAGLVCRPGDICLLFTGFFEAYDQLDQGERVLMADRASMAAAGVEHTEAMAEFLWDAGFAAVVSDAPTVEVWPSDQSTSASPFGFLHRVLLGQFGMAIGELWALADLVSDCRTDGRFECLLASAPMHQPGGIGSPANALAIK